MPFITGQVVYQRYTIIAPLSEGGFSTIYLAFDRNDRRMVVIKESKSGDPDMQNALLEETKIFQQVQHPHIPKIANYFHSSENRVCVAMEYILGENLETFYTRGQTPSIETTLTWIRQILDALATLHTHNPPVVHRDIKLGNIQIHAITGVAYLIDFGIAKIGDYTTIAAYTAPFAPPEQYRRGATTPATDVYAVGVCLYMLLTGHAPPEGVARSNQPLVTPRERNPVIPPLLEQVILTAMAVEPTDRYPNAQAMLDALTPIAITQGEQVKPFSLDQILGQFKAMIEPLQAQNRALDDTTTQRYEAQRETLSQQLAQLQESVQSLVFNELQKQNDMLNAALNERMKQLVTEAQAAIIAQVDKRVQPLGTAIAQVDQRVQQTGTATQGEQQRIRQVTESTQATITQVDQRLQKFQGMLDTIQRQIERLQEANLTTNPHESDLTTSDLRENLLVKIQEELKKLQQIGLWAAVIVAILLLVVGRGWVVEQVRQPSFTPTVVGSVPSVAPKQPPTATGVAAPTAVVAPTVVAPTTPAGASTAPVAATAVTEAIPSPTPDPNQITMNLGQELVLSNIESPAAITVVTATIGEQRFPLKANLDSTKKQLKVTVPVILLAQVNVDFGLPTNFSLDLGSGGQPITAVMPQQAVTVRGVDLLGTTPNPDIYGEKRTRVKSVTVYTKYGAILWESPDPAKRDTMTDIVRPLNSVGLVVLVNGDRVEILGGNLEYYYVKVITNQLDGERAIGLEGWVRKVIIDGP